MTQRTRYGIEAEILGNLPDNTTGEIDAQDMRSTLDDINDSTMNYIDGAEILPPTGFTFTDYGFNIRNVGYGKFLTDFDPEDYIVDGVNYYVNPSTGNDANTGLSLAQAKQSISSAVTAANTAGVPAIFNLASGVYTLTRTFYDVIPKIPFSMICEEGSADLICGNILTYTATGGATPNVYETTIGAPNPIWGVDYTNIDEYGNYKPLTVVGSIAEVDATPNSCFASGTTLYVRLFDDRAPDSNFYTLRDVLGHRTYALTDATPPAQQDVYIEGVNFIGGASRGFYVASVPGTICLNRCTFGYSYSGNALSITRDDSHKTYLSACVARYSRTLDGFNYHQGTGSGVCTPVVEINCESYYNGLDGGVSNNGSTTHDGGSIIRIGTIALKNQNRNFHDIQASKSWMLGCKAGYAQLQTNVDDSVDFQIGQSTDTAIMWLDQCESLSGGGLHSRASINLTAGCTMYCRNTDYKNFKGATKNRGTITTY